MRQPKNYTGLQFTRLTIIEKCGEDKAGNPKFLCQCECGNKTIAQLGNLYSGRKKSCGCLKKEYYASEALKEQTRKIMPNLPADVMAARNRKISEAHIGLTTGAQCWNWKGGREARRARIMLSKLYKTWRRLVIERDGKCVKCGSVNNLQADHIIRFASILDTLPIDSAPDTYQYKWAFTPGIGRTLCIPCHELADVGTGKNTPPNKEEFERLKSEVMTIQELKHAVRLVSTNPSAVTGYISTRSDYLEFANKVLSEV